MKTNPFLFRRTLVFLMMTLGLCSLKAQTQVFYEDFEKPAFPPEGWQVIEDNSDSVYYHWQIFAYDDGYPTLGGGLRSAYIDTKVYQTSEDYPEHPKTEWLITPDIEMPADYSCKLSFLWQAHKRAYEEMCYNTWVLVSTNKGITWDTVWHLLDPLMMINSGTPWPWGSFGENRADVDLSKYKGKSVRIAWLYRNFYKGQGDLFKLDNISVEKWTPLTGPVAQLSPETFEFPESYMNVSIFSGNVFQLTNVGIDTLKVLSIEGLEGTDFSIPADFSSVALMRNNAVRFGVIYTPTNNGARTATARIETNGGTVEVTLSGSKIGLPAGYTLESFEDPFFPPVGWTGSGWRRIIATAASGEACAVPTLSMTRVYLQSPRLDLSTGSNHYVVFDWADLLSVEQEGWDNTDVVEFSEDGGATWTTLFTTDPSDESTWTREKINLNSTSNNAYIRFSCKIEDLSSDSEISGWYLDNVVLPPLYGATSAPVAATDPKPANEATDQYVNNLTLSWTPVLHATSYKVKVGTSAANLTDVLDVEQSGYTVTLQGLSYNTTYYWQVIPTNIYGQASSVSTWSFTTMKDPTISTFPYLEGFEGEQFPSLGWRISGDNKWDRSTFKPYEGEYAAVSSSQEGSSILSMPPLRLPEDQVMQVSFVWGNSFPVSLTIPDGPMKAEPVAKRHNVDTIYFEISTDEVNWNVVSFVSDEPDENDNYYWRRCKYTLEDYAGRVVYLRWRYSCVNYGRSRGSSLDNVLVGEYSSTGQILFSHTVFDAGVVNYRHTVSSNNYYFINDGAVDLKVKNVSFKSRNFSTDIAVGDEIKADKAQTYSIFFTAFEPGVVSDSMCIEFENGLVAKQAVNGHALDSNTRCFTFEFDEPFSTTTVENFTVIDVDGNTTAKPVLINYPNYGAPFAFIVMNVLEADWRNINPVSGVQCLYASCPSESLSGTTMADDWLISDPMTASAQSRFRFFAKSYGNPEDFELHKISVLVSESDNNRSSFTALKGWENIEVPYSSVGEFKEFSVDLSAYAGKRIFVAVRHTVSEDGFVMFMDDLWFENFVFTAIDNHAPRFLTTPPTEATVNQEFTYTFRAIDPDGDPLTFTTRGVPSWLKLELDDANGGTLRGVPTQEGEVMFVITASDNMVSNSQEVLLTVKPSVDNETNESAMVKFYPNPVKKDVLNIRVDVDNYRVMLVGADGRIAVQGMNLNAIDMRQMPSGIYVLQVRTADRVMNFKVVKQ